jgi:hypothetical protein
VNEAFISHAYADVFADLVHCLEEHEAALLAPDAPLSPLDSAVPPPPDANDDSPRFYYMDLFCEGQDLNVAGRCTKCEREFEYDGTSPGKPRRCEFCSGGRAARARSGSGGAAAAAAEPAADAEPFAAAAAVAAAGAEAPPAAAAVGVIDADELVRTFATNVRNAPCVLLMISNLKDPAPLKRLWVVFEIFSALQNPAKSVRIMSPKKDHAELREILTASDMDEALSKLADRVDTRDAVARESGDAAKARAAVDFDKVNDALFTALVLWLAELVVESRDPGLMAKLSQFLSAGGEHPELAHKLAVRARSAIEAKLDELDGFSEHLSNLYRKITRRVAITLRARSGGSASTDSAFSPKAI